MPRTAYVAVQSKRIISYPVVTFSDTLRDAPTITQGKVTEMTRRYEAEPVTEETLDPVKEEGTDLPGEPVPYQGSAARLGTGNIPGTDVQWPPGRVENAGSAYATTVPVGGINAPMDAADSTVNVADIPDHVLAANPPDEG